RTRLLPARLALPVPAARLYAGAARSVGRRTALSLAPLPRPARRSAARHRPPALPALLPAHVSLADRRVAERALGAPLRRQRRVPLRRHGRHHAPHGDPAGGGGD